MIPLFMRVVLGRPHAYLGRQVQKLTDLRELPYQLVFGWDIPTSSISPSACDSQGKSITNKLYSPVFPDGGKQRAPLP